MRMFLAWIYIILNVYGVLIACIAFVIGYFYLFLISGFRKGKEYAQKDYDYFEGFK